MNAGFVAVDDAWPHPYENELRVVRSILLERFPRLRTRQGRDLILAVRQIANEEIRRGAKGGDLTSPFLMIQSSVIEKTAEHSCQGINAVFRVMLAALSIESRAIGFYTDNEQEPGQAIISHAISDVLIEGRWEAMDPTFDVSILHNNRPVDWPTVYALVRSGQSITTEPGLAADKRQWERYALNLSRDMNYLVAIGRDGFTLPPSWDGSYRIRGVLRTNLLTQGLSIDRHLSPLVPAPKPARRKIIISD